MNIINGVIGICSVFIDMFILYRIFHKLLNSKSEKKKLEADFLLSIIGALLFWFSNSIAVLSDCSMILIVLYFSLTAQLLYHENYVITFSISSFYVLCMGAFNYIMSDIDGGSGVLAVIFNKVIWVCLYLLMRKYLAKLSKSRNYMFIIAFISCAGFIGFMYLVNQMFHLYTNITSSVMFLFMCLFAFFFFGVYFIVESRDRKKRLVLAEMQNNMLREKYHSINEVYTKNAQLFHDLNNHLTVLYQLIDENDMEKAKSYIEQISEPIMVLSKKVWTGMDVIDAIINSKLQQMENQKIDAKIDVEFPQNTNIEENDMCTVISNLLDNAIEAVEDRGGYGTIRLNIRRINYFLMLQVVNPFDSKKLIDLELPETTKADKELHGWGLRNVISVAEKYSGTVKFKREKDELTVTVMLFFEKVKASET